MTKLENLQRHLELAMAATDGWCSESDKRAKDVLLTVKQRIRDALGMVNHELKIVQVNAELDQGGRAHGQP